MQFFMSYDFVQGHSDLFSKTQLTAIENFRRIVESLPPEEDEFWADESLNSDEWEYVRTQARDTLKALS